MVVGWAAGPTSIVAAVSLSALPGPQVVVDLPLKMTSSFTQAAPEHVAPVVRVAVSSTVFQSPSFRVPGIEHRKALAALPP